MFVMRASKRIRPIKPAKTPRGFARQLERFLRKLQTHPEAAAHHPNFAAVLAPFIEELHRQADAGLRTLDQRGLDRIRDLPAIELPKPH